MRRALILAGALSLAGCGARYEQVRACHHEAGERPYTALYVFGVIGALAAESTPEDRVWRASVAGCMERYREAGR
jgi:hypothetical protein